MAVSDRLSILIPTVDPSRPLARCLASIAEQPLHEGDEVLVIGDTTDGPLTKIEEVVNQFGPPFRYLPLAGTAHDWGHSQFNYGITQAQGDWILGQDDDDAYVPGAFGAVRRSIAELDEPRPMLFRFVTHYGFCFWDQKRVEEGHIGGHCAVFPNIPERIGRCSSRYEGDYDYLVSTLVLWPADSVVWCRDILTIARPG